jgi:RNA polymerase sigma-70 factor (ECF subfamily)
MVERDRRREEERPEIAAAFDTTHWSVVLAAGQADSPRSAEALEELCRAYWYPLYAFVRRKGYSPEDAQDLTQAFFERLLEKHYLRDVLAERGRFRTFLLACLGYFLANERDRTQALKRGGGLVILTLDPTVLEGRYCSDVGVQDPPERHFDRLWAEAVMDRALTRLEDEFGAAGKAVQFDALAEFVSRSPDHGEYTRVGERLSLSSHAVAMAVARLRDRYRTLVRAEVADTVHSAADLETELHYLVELISR